MHVFTPRKQMIFIWKSQNIFYGIAMKSHFLKFFL